MFCRGRQFISGFPGPLRFDSRRALPLPNLGFSLAGLASFHLDVAIKLVSVARLWALGHVLRLPLRATARGVISSPTAITTVITDGASMDFPLLSEQPSRSDILFSKAFSDRRPLHRGLFPNDRCIAAIGRWSN